MSKRSAVIRDPVHGDIHLGSDELQIIDTPDMQRLRGVRQLGTAYLVYTGLNLLYDDRVVEYFGVDRASGHLFVDVAKRGMIRQDILSELVRVLDARYFFSERVYYRHAKIAAGAMIAHAVEMALAEGGLSPQDLWRQTDDSLLRTLADHAPPDPAQRRRFEALIKNFKSRRAFERAVEDAVRADGLEPPMVVLYCPARRMQLKEAQTRVRFPGDRIRPLARFTQAVPRLEELERACRGLWQLYVLAASDDVSVLERIATAVGELLPGAVNAYRPAE